MKPIIFGLSLLFHFAYEIYCLESEITAKNRKNLHCQQITGYYNGTFQRLMDPSATFDVQLQVTGEINIADKNLYFKFDNFNRNYASGYEFWLFNATDYVDCNTTQIEPCSIKFNNTLSNFLINFESFENGYSPQLIYIDPLQNKRFTLLNAVGNCATTLENNNMNDLVGYLFNSCFCCGDKYNPDPSLDCPISPWS